MVCEPDPAHVAAAVSGPPGCQLATRSCGEGREARPGACCRIQGLWAPLGTAVGGRRASKGRHSCSRPSATKPVASAVAPAPRSLALPLHTPQWSQHHMPHAAAALGQSWSWCCCVLCSALPQCPVLCAGAWAQAGTVWSVPLLRAPGQSWSQSSVPVVQARATAAFTATTVCSVLKP